MVTEIVGGVCVVIAAIIAAYATIKSKKLEKETKTIAEINRGVVFDLKLLNRIKNAVDDLFLNTNSDRFLILMASNGSSELKFASVIYEHHKSTDKTALSIGAVNKYVRFEFDHYYRDMLKALSVTPSELVVNDMKDSDLKHIYMKEGVAHASLFHLHRIVDYDGFKNDLLFYCSIATHDNEPFTSQDKVIMKAVVNVIRSNIKKLGK